MVLYALIAPDEAAPVAVRCPVCNQPVVLGKPAGRFRVKCNKRTCGTIVEVIHAPGASYSSGPAWARSSEEEPGHANSRRL